MKKEFRKMTDKELEAYKEKVIDEMREVLIERQKREKQKRDLVEKTCSNLIDLFFHNKFIIVNEKGEELSFSIEKRDKEGIVISVG